MEKQRGASGKTLFYVLYTRQHSQEPAGIPALGSAPCAKPRESCAREPLCQGTPVWDGRMAVPGAGELGVIPPQCSDSPRNGEPCPAKQG